MLTRSCSRTILRSLINDFKRDLSSTNNNNNDTNHFNKKSSCIYTTTNLMKFNYQNNLSRIKFCHQNNWKIFPITNFSTLVPTSTSLDSNELHEFKSISPQDKKNVAKCLGLKSSFLNETDVYVSSDMKNLVLNFSYSNNGVDIENCPINYKIIDKNSHHNETIPSLRELETCPDFLFYHFEKSVPQNFDFSNYLNNETLTIFDDIFDALAFYQQTKLPTIVVKLMNKSISCDSYFKDFCVKLDNHFKKVYLWPRSDGLFEDLRKNLIKNIDSKKIYFLNSDSKASKMLLDDPKEKFDTILKNAVPVHHPSILNFNDLKDDVFKEFNDPTICGVQWSRFSMLNEHLKGHRAGELTIVTGPTGCGKTTFVSEYSLDLCMQGVPTLWGSFEIKNVRLIKTMLTQFARQTISFSSNRDVFEKECEEFAKLPLYFMKFHGQTEVDLFMNAAKHAVKALGIKHIIVDNLQFMLGMNVESNYDRFLKQDSLISSLRQFSTDYNCHMTLVAHPRKEKEEITLSNNSLYGGIKASQEADNVLIIMNKFNARYRCNKYIQITKNRFNGSLGIVPLYFDKNTLCFSSTVNNNNQKQHNQTVDPTKILQDYSGKDDVSDVYRMRYLLEN